MSTTFETLLGVILTVAAVAPVGAGEPAPLLDLEQAVQTAIDNNHLLGAVDAELAAADAQLRDARGARLPRIELRETVSRTTNPVFVFGQLLGQEAFGPQNFAIDSLNQPEALGNFNTALIMDQPLYTGGKIRQGIAAAEDALDAARSRRERTRQEVVHQVLAGYSAAVVAEARLSVAVEALETAQANVKLVRDLRQAGLVIESDLLQARVRQSEVEESVVRAESAVAVTRSSLNLVLGRDLATPFSLPSSPDRDPAGGESLDQLVREALAARPDLRGAGSQTAAARRAVRLARAEYRPRLGLSGTYETNAEDFVGADGANWSVFLGLRLTLFDGRRTAARVARAEAEQIRAERLRDLLAQSVELEVRQAFHERRAALKRLEQTRGVVGLAEESLRTVRDRYAEGLSTLVELLDAETALTRARTRKVAARGDLLLAEATLRLAVGRL